MWPATAPVYQCQGEAIAKLDIGRGTLATIQRCQMLQAKICAALLYSEKTRRPATGGSHTPGFICPPLHLVCALLFQARVRLVNAVIAPPENGSLVVVSSQPAPVPLLSLHKNPALCPPGEQTDA